MEEPVGEVESEAVLLVLPLPTADPMCFKASSPAAETHTEGGREEPW